MARHGRSRGTLEHEVLASLGSAGAPMSVQQVLDDVDPSLAYTTVMTTLVRLHAKNAVTREQSGRAYLYSLPGGPDAARASMTAHSMHRLLDQGDDHRTVLSRFVAELSPADEKLLRRVLDGRTGPRRPTTP
ncbi:BlaI/MecI/CopY family transcriptional regulator [Jatrophihabitans endophyticus]|uniref:BlaI/MecI/CopY family transcriptional regulator n=1 Tax=Jatrophihabitans endophyticus TaxID=1206085 RepID=UPI0019E25F65|nr:BlaI/MecI/CopY family transcriptional regulator [Jatrophihabitans endophyticus]MBE7187859.1 BlaI/MecI/CopY family transcriptional regulator [Jatrophihabitans endophyticus]